MKKTELKLKIGNVYERRDGRLAFIYGYDAVYNTFECVLQSSGQRFSVHEDGNYLQYGASHNDLIRLVK